MVDNVCFYCVNFKDENRRAKILSRFSTLGVAVHFTDPVEITDTRLTIPIIDISEEKRVWAIMLQHIDSIRHFVENNSTANFCVVCEDDVLLSKNLISDMETIQATFYLLDLDILLLGYLIPFDVPNNEHFPLQSTLGKYSFHDYPSDLWGSQMYMISRSHAIALIKRYTVEHGIETIGQLPFSPDWTLTKYGKKALISPMVAIEEGYTKTTENSQISFHQRCFLHNFRENDFI